MTLVPGELRGYRWFRLAEDGLFPAVHAAGGPWSAGLTRAVCAAGEDHEAPAAGCACGLYAWYRPGDAASGTGFGNVRAVVAAQGRAVLGDYGFRTAAARVVAVAAPPRWHPVLARDYPDVAVYRSRRAMLRDHPPDDLAALGIEARVSPARRYRRLALLTWALGGLVLLTLAVLPRTTIWRAGPALKVTDLVAFVGWQALLLWLWVRASRSAADRKPGRTGT